MRNRRTGEHLFINLELAFQSMVHWSRRFLHPTDSWIPTSFWGSLQFRRFNPAQPPPLQLPLKDEKRKWNSQTRPNTAATELNWMQTTRKMTNSLRPSTIGNFLCRNAPRSRPMSTGYLLPRSANCLFPSDNILIYRARANLQCDFDSFSGCVMSSYWFATDRSTNLSYL